jgi:ATP-dependent Lon protease
MADYPDLKNPLPLLITRGIVPIPSYSTNIEISRAISISAVHESETNHDDYIYIVAQKTPDTDNPNVEDLYGFGTLCHIVSYTYLKTYIRIKVMPLEVVKFNSFELNDNFATAIAEIMPAIPGNPKEEIDVFKELSNSIASAPEIISNMPKEILNSFSNGVNADSLSNSLANYLNLNTAQREAIIEERDTTERLKLLNSFVKEQSEIAQIDAHIDDELRKSAEKNQKDYFLREKMRIIKEELGDDGSGDDIEKKLEANPYPEHLKNKVKEEIKKMNLNPQGSQEAALIRGYIDTILSVPWFEVTKDNDDLENVRKILDEDHYGLEKPKKRIIEYLAVKKMTGNLKAPILCLYGPPGCGKTSLAMSIARALNRNFVKVSLGGLYDESEIRGHRRTYVGSMPGRIIKGMIRAKATNPVFLLDEIDKVGHDSFKGDPSSALLEVMDPEQNAQFSDNYLEEPYDLSNVLFIATANNIENIPAPLLDRLELVEIPSYTELEKIEIAKHYLVPKNLVACGLKASQISFDDEAIDYIIMHYTREAGVRELERQLSSIIRKVVVELVNGETKGKKHITISQVKKYLGTEIFEVSEKDKDAQVGVVTGLAYTEFGGDILQIEVTSFKGKGALILTGHLGDVMKESCSIALDYVRTNAVKYGINPDIFQQLDVHIHVPEGAIPKDGPSAGVAITTAIISCLTNRKISSDVAITGEVTLRGNALPIGGLREKSLAALRSGIKTIIVPRENKKNVDELPKEVKENLNIIFMNNVDDAIKGCFIKND